MAATDPHADIVDGLIAVTQHPKSGNSDPVVIAVGAAGGLEESGGVGNVRMFPEPKHGPKGVRRARRGYDPRTQPDRTAAEDYRALGDGAGGNRKRGSTGPRRVAEGGGQGDGVQTRDAGDGHAALDFDWKLRLVVVAEVEIDVGSQMHGHVRVVSDDVDKLIAPNPSFLIVGASRDLDDRPLGRARGRLRSRHLDERQRKNQGHPLEMSHRGVSSRVDRLLTLGNIKLRGMTTSGGQ